VSAVGVGSVRSAALVDGAQVTSVDVLDRGLHFGDGLFETIACPRGTPRLLDLHLARLLSGCARLKIPFTDDAVLRAEIAALSVGGEAVLLKVIVDRGSATARGYGPHGDERPRRIVLRYEWPAEPPQWREEGVPVRIAALALGENPALAGLKHLNRLEQVLARAEAPDSRALEALLFSSSGSLISGTMSNVFLVRDGRLYTPRLDRCGVAGVMRQALMTQAQRAQIAVTEAVLGRTELEQAEEIFLTNARIGIWPVRTLEGRKLGVGTLTRRLQRLMQPLLEG
jgi:4-amino-4-deoxychorismate lyase